MTLEALEMFFHSPPLPVGSLDVLHGVRRGGKRGETSVPFAFYAIFHHARESEALYKDALFTVSGREEVGTSAEGIAPQSENGMHFSGYDRSQQVFRVVASVENQHVPLAQVSE
jgi:hypothetical protein